MKRISAIVRPEKLEALKEALSAAKVNGMTISQVMGCGTQHGWKEYYRGTEVMLNTIPKIRFEIITEEERVDEIVDIICETARTGNVGDGKIFVTPVDEVVRIRTGERGNKAV
ncbi:P-II family nitrogen regulator [Phoenicibacter congonensis]|uniref:P-II family nitrogen regulator n=1 Tax=Phoenicibacter congonensis TaxID=1944646 RepID=UPI0009A861E8|nr:P-II family nitrogen regulator [Phoenicibacter congonensis]